MVTYGSSLGFICRCAKKEFVMDTEKIVRDTLSAFETGNTSKAGSYLADDFTFSGPVPQPVSKTDFLKLQGALIKAMPNWKFNSSNMQVKGDTVTSTVH